MIHVHVKMEYISFSYFSKYIYNIILFIKSNINKAILNTVLNNLIPMVFKSY